MFCIECWRRSKCWAAFVDHSSAAGRSSAVCFKCPHGRNGRVSMFSHKQWNLKWIAAHHMVQRWSTIAAIKSNGRHAHHYQRGSWRQGNVSVRGATTRKRHISSIGWTTTWRSVDFRFIFRCFFESINWKIGFGCWENEKTIRFDLLLKFLYSKLATEKFDFYFYFFSLSSQMLRQCCCTVLLSKHFNRDRPFHWNAQQPEIRHRK